MDRVLFKIHPPATANMEFQVAHTHGEKSENEGYWNSLLVARDATLYLVESLEMSRAVTIESSYYLREEEPDVGRGRPR